MALKVQLDPHRRTARWCYAVDLVLGVLLEMDWHWVEHGGDLVIEGNLGHSGLLDGEERVSNPPLTSWNGWDLPFVVEGELDAFAFAFWMATRMEEWGEAERDAHGRCTGAGSWSGRHGLLETPVVEEVVRAWAVRVGLQAQIRRTFRWIATVDVDNAFAYRHKPFLRTMGGFAKDLLEWNWEGFHTRFLACSGQIRDPFDTYSDLLEFHASAGVQTRVFFLLANRGEHDRGVHPGSKGLADTIRRVAKSAPIGIHPGYASHGNADRIALERGRLKSIALEDIQHARQHYLLHDARKAWTALVEAGITEDWSMGYADAIGFRAGIARPFPAFDLGSNRALPLLIHPVLVMDATLARYMRLLPNQDALNRVWAAAERAAAVGGDCVSIWHNETFAGKGEWAPWLKFYQTLLQERPLELR